MVRRLLLVPTMMLYIGLGMIALGVLAAALGLLFRSKVKKILATPVCKTGEAARAGDSGGMASCEGAVLTAARLTAPCSQRPCVYYQLRVEQQVKESQGGQTRTSWKLLAEHHAGSMFHLDDGSGALLVDGRAKLDADLREVFTGPPPGGPGLGVLAGLIQPMPYAGRGEILGTRVSERIIGLDAPLFAMGQLRGGALSGPNGKAVVVSDRGRQGLVGARKRTATIALAVSAALMLGAVPVIVLRPGPLAACGPLENTVAACAISSKRVTLQEPQADGSKKPVDVEQTLLEWKVTQPGVYQLSARQEATKGRSFPRIQVEEATTGFPVNIGINLGFGADSAKATTTKTASLRAGTYKIYVWSDVGGPSRFHLSIAPAAEKAASR